MLIYDDIFEWEGFGGKLRIGAGKCRLRVFDVQMQSPKKLAQLKSTIVVASDVPESSMSVKSCVSHIATRVAAVFKIAPLRMLFVEHYPQVYYGPKNDKQIPERYDLVDFQWHGDKALHPSWRALKPPLLDTVKALVGDTAT